MYIKAMTVEQLYDSLLIATRADQTAAGGYEAAQQQKREWLAEFMRIFGGNDQDEPTLFSGTIPQALMLMNGELTARAVSPEAGSFLNSILSNAKLRSDKQRIQVLYLSALGRIPTRQEYSKIERTMGGIANPVEAYQDLYWALLNSNEFTLNH
jgi:hypothetical protein